MAHRFFVLLLLSFTHPLDEKSKLKRMFRVYTHPFEVQL